MKSVRAGRFDPYAIPCAVSSLEQLEPRLLLSGEVIISEFMALNDSTLADEDGEFSDWIELHNQSAMDISLAGYTLTDDIGDPGKYVLPDVTINAGGYLVVFASSKNRTDPAGELHTSFGMAASGEYLALFEPGNPIPVTQFNPFPPQFADVSYGVTQQSETLVAEGALLTYLIPTAGNAGLGTTWTAENFDDSAWDDQVVASSSSLLITEAGTGSPDYLEIHNVSDETIDTSGWVVAVNQANNIDINDVNFDQWQLPATFDPGEVQYRTDDILDNWWGSNIWWSTAGNGWVMIVDDGGNVIDFVVWGYSSGDIASMDVTINGFNISPSESWNGGSVAANGTSSNSLQRTGHTDNNNANDWGFRSPQSRGAPNESLVTPFSGGLKPAATGIGFNVDGVPNLAAGFTVTTYEANVTVNSTAVAQVVIDNPGQQDKVTVGNSPVINFVNTGPTGNYGGDTQFPGLSGSIDTQDFISESIGKIYIPSPGEWTFGVHSDDGFRLDITNGPDNFMMEWPGTRTPQDSLDVFNVTQPGVYDVRLLHFDRSGGGEVELFAAAGARNVFDPLAFDLVGDTLNGGLEVVNFDRAISSNVEDDMRNVNASLWTRIDFDVDDPVGLDALTLRMKYDDGFVAYLNGVEVARRNAPGATAWNSSATGQRNDDQAAVFEDINITSFIGNLQAGNNTLAIHGLNFTAADDDFLVLPELVATGTNLTSEFFATPTPGAPNLPGVLDFVADTQFSVDRGFFDTAFNLEITTKTPGATIYYTTDGTDPSPTNGMMYTGPINITQTSVIRAIATKVGFQPTNIDTHSYFFVSDIVTQSGTPTDFPSGNVNGQILNYGMDPDITNHATWGPLVDDALLDIPSLSIVTDADNLFDPSIGIYVNAQNRGIAWERQVSFELLDPDGSDGFQVEGGLRIRGGFSRSDGNPKHALRIFFRSAYGDAKLNFPMFDDEGVDKFDVIELRTAQNYSWSFQGSSGSKNTFMRDVFSRDSQGAMGQPYSRSRFYHLYLNGTYWGLYQTEERAEASYAESYFGGAKEDYDVIHATSNTHRTEATDGNLDAWQEVHNIMLAGLASDANYLKLQGLNPDGSNNPAFAKLVDIDNIADYMILTYFTGNRDGPGSFFTRPGTNNWFGVYNRENPDGFKFFARDFEHSLDTGGNTVSPLYIDHGSLNEAGHFDRFNPHWLHERLMDNAEYRQYFADRVQLHFFNGGALTESNSITRIEGRAAQIDLAIIAESARWGDSKVSNPRDKDDWISAVNTAKNWIIGRHQTVLNQLAGEGWWPGVDPPMFNQHGGQVPEGFNVTISGGPGTIYYTIDGSDPRLYGGGVSGNAVAYTGTPIVINNSTVIKARVLNGGVWSPLIEGDFRVHDPADATNLAISEINYNPFAPTPTEIGSGFTDPDDFEFIELANIGDVTIDIADVQFTDGVTYSFAGSAVTSLDAGEFVLVVRNMNAFEARYGMGLPVAGVYSGGLSNGGEHVELRDGNNLVIHGFDYNDSGSWPGRADGSGSTTEIIDVFTQAPGSIDYNDGDSWRASSEYGGSPGALGGGPDNRVVINEVLTHTDLPQKDSIELFNTTGADINIGGWYLSDSTADYEKFMIPLNTMLPAGGYIVFDEDDFNSSGGVDPKDFALSSSTGDDVFLVETSTGDGNLIGFVDRVTFGAAANGESFGRWVNGVGSLTPMTSLSLGNVNTGPRVGPVVISEIMYNPVDPGNLPAGVTVKDIEFVEIHNATGSAIDLTNWKLRGGVDFDFAAGASLASMATMVILAFDPDNAADANKATAFQNVYGVNVNSINTVGPFSGSLNNAGETVRLHRPDDPPVENPLLFPELTEDEVQYEPLLPWPTTADGGGDSLTRTSLDGYGNFASSWVGDHPTPGSVSFTTDLVATAFDALTDHVLLGQTDVMFSIANMGDSAAASFDVDIVYSDDSTITSGDTVVASITISGLDAGTTDTRTVSIQLPRNVLNTRAQADDPPGQSVGHTSTSFDYVGIIVDANSEVAESNENNNRDQGDGVDKDDVTYFPWDIDDDGQVTSVDAIFVINRIGQVVDAGNALADFDGDGQISSTDAIAVINRLGYVRNESALLSAPLQSPQAASSVSGDQFMSAIHMQTQVTNSIQSNARERVYRQLLGDDTDDDDTVDLFAF